MTTLQKKSKLGINLYSTGTFLNLKKPKFLSIDKSVSFKKKNLKLKNINHNISEDISNLETYTKLTENTNKDEIIKVLKERLTNLENKVKLLEKENKDKTEKLNALNLTQWSQNKEKKFRLSQPEIKLNLKLIKNKNNKNIFKNLNLSRNSKKEITKTITNNPSFNSIMNNNKSKNTFYNSNYINSNKNIKNNFFNIFNINNSGSRMKISNSSIKNMGKHCILITKKKLFADAIKKTLNKASSIDSDKFKNNKLKDDFNKNIPKIPRKKKHLGSDIITNTSNKYNIKISFPPEDIIFRFKRSNSEKKPNFVIINNNSSKEKDNIKDLNTDARNSNISYFEDIKKKLENIKSRTKYLLEYYSSNNNNTNKIII